MKTSLWLYVEVITKFRAPAMHSVLLLKVFTFASAVYIIYRLYTVRFVWNVT